MTKQCTKCGETKPIESFPRRYGRSTHLRENTCGMCKRRAHLKRHPEKKQNEYVRRRSRQRGVSVQDYLNQFSHQKLRKPRKTRGTRCPLLRAYPKVEYQVNRAYYLAKSKRWYRANPSAALAKKQRRRFRLAGVERSLSAPQWERIKQAFDYRCAYCGQQGKLTMDHITPISKGGGHVVGNVVPACSRCNSSKHVGPPPCPVQPMLIV